MENSIPWTEKYRPSSIKDLVLDEQIEKQIKIFLLDRPNTHLILTGPPGVGKTSTVRCIAQEILGSTLKDAYLELNAGDDRGVKNITYKIPPFCKRLVTDCNTKIILLDEADSMTPKSQYDIGDIIKQYGKKVRFIFTCNDSTKIIEDIQSVSRIIRFKPQTESQIKKNLAKICDAEGISYDDAGLATICYISNGDMRNSINDLQKTACTYGKVTEKVVLRICKIPDPKDIQRIIKLCQENNFVQADNEINKIIKDGYYYLDIISGFVYVLTRSDMDEDLKLRLIRIVNETKIVVSKGLRSKLQLSAMICRLVAEINK